MPVADAAVPSALAPSLSPFSGLGGASYLRALWSPEDLASLVATLVFPSRDVLSDQRLVEVWSETVEVFRDEGSKERQELDPLLSKLLGLSREGLAAGLGVILQGATRPFAQKLGSRARDSEPGEPALAVLAGTVPALAVQPLLPALLLRVPLVLKSASGEPLFAPAFVAALKDREPALDRAMAALTWPGGDRELEAPVLQRCLRVVAYGDDENLADLGRRAPGRVLGHGSKLSLAVVGGEVDPKEVADGLARDVALLDQRGCLSVQAVVTAGDAVDLADELACSLGRYAQLWPPGELDAGPLSSVQQLRAEAVMRGLYLADLDPFQGTVVVESQPPLLPSPGLRTVRIHTLEDLARLPALLEPWKGRLQGVALAGSSAWRLEPRLLELGISRTAVPGELQLADASWRNGGHDPLESFL